MMKCLVVAEGGKTRCLFSPVQREIKQDPDAPDIKHDIHKTRVLFVLSAVMNEPMLSGLSCAGFT